MEVTVSQRWAEAVRNVEAELNERYGFMFNDTPQLREFLRNQVITKLEARGFYPAHVRVNVIDDGARMELEITPGSED